MYYSVQIVENQIIGPEENSGLAAYFLNDRFSTIQLAEEAGTAELKRRAGEGARGFYNILDPESRPVWPKGSVE